MSGRTSYLFVRSSTLDLILDELGHWIDALPDQEETSCPEILQLV
jgi:hypothetical protein